MKTIDPFPVDEEKEDLTEHTRYVNLFTSLGYKKSYKLVNYYQMKVLKFGVDYNNPNRKELMKTLMIFLKNYQCLMK